MIVSTWLSSLSVDGYEAHSTHGDDRVWPETNCYVDLWIEVLNALRLDPVAALAFTVSTNFDGEQWEFFKYPPEDLRALFGLEVREINVWRPIASHIEEHLQLGHLLTVEADAYYLPDTTGVSYHSDHQKTTIAPQMIDPVEKRLRYFHNRGFFELRGDDYDGALRTDPSLAGWQPYCEVIVLDHMRSPTPGELRSAVNTLVKEHLGRRPSTNPVPRLADRIQADVEWLATQTQESFHAYAFGSLRQCGAWAEMLASFTSWLDPDGLAVAAEAFTQLASSAKTCQFKLARAAIGRSTDLGGPLMAMAERWTEGYAALVEQYGG